MSHPYRVTVTHCTEETLSSEDYTQCKIDLTPILPEDRMKSILEQTLEENGWTHDQERDVWVKERENGERVEINVDDLTCTTFIEIEGSISKSKTVNAAGDNWNGKNIEEERKRLEDKVRSSLERELKISETEKQKKQEELSHQASNHLKNSEEARNKELNEVLVETYSHALQEKAKSLGEITEISESKNENEYELIIKIKS
ncbi:MAG: hypothetical protein AABZ60_01550 [Planctomycetota bacterium]